MAQNLQSIQTFLTLEQSQYHKSGSEPVAAHCYCSRLGWETAQAVQESCPKSLAVDFSPSALDYLLEQPSERLPDDLQGLKLGLKLEICRLTNEL